MLGSDALAGPSRRATSPETTMAKRSNTSKSAEPAETEVVDLDGMDGMDFGTDAEFIEPKSDLRSKTKPKPGKASAGDPVEAAEAAMARMAESFDGWMADETSRLVELFAEAEETGFDGDALEAFHRAAHDIKGQAATLGFPLAGRIAAGLCKLIEAKSATGRFSGELALQHVQSVRAIIREQARDDGSPTARRLADKLDEVTGDWLEQIGQAA